MGERIIERNFHLHKESRDAYKSYIHAYAAHSQKDCFDVERLDLARVAKSFGFSTPPKVELAIKHRVNKKNKGQHGQHGPRGSGEEGAAITSHNRFSAENPYGRREKSDKRQF